MIETIRNNNCGASVLWEALFQSIMLGITQLRAANDLSKESTSANMSQYYRNKGFRLSRATVIFVR